MKIEINSKEIDIDDEIVQLIVELNKIGLKTLYSCSGHGGKTPYLSIDMHNIREVLVNKGSLNIYWDREENQQHIIEYSKTKDKFHISTVADKKLLPKNDYETVACYNTEEELLKSLDALISYKEILKKGE